MIRKLSAWLKSSKTSFSQKWGFRLTVINFIILTLLIGGLLINNFHFKNYLKTNNDKPASPEMFPSTTLAKPAVPFPSTLNNNNPSVNNIVSYPQNALSSSELLLKKGPYEVKKIRNMEIKSNETLNNQIWPQQVLLDVHFPDIPDNKLQKFPLIIISHPTVPASMAPARKQFDYLTEHLVSYGYVVGIYEWSLDLGQCEIFRNSEREANVVRFFEEKNNDPFSPFYHLVDTNNIGLIGHSNGAFAQYFAKTNPSVHAFVGLSGMLCEWGGFYQDIADTAKPFLYIGASKDQLRANTKRLQFYGLWDFHSGPKIMFDVKNGDHWQFTDNYIYYPDIISHYSKTDNIFKQLYAVCQTELSDNDPSNDSHCREQYLPRETQHQIVNYFVTAFFETYLKNNKNYLPAITAPPAIIQQNIANFVNSNLK